MLKALKVSSTLSAKMFWPEDDTPPKEDDLRLTNNRLSALSGGGCAANMQSLSVTNYMFDLLSEMLRDAKATRYLAFRYLHIPGPYAQRGV